MGGGGGGGLFGLVSGSAPLVFGDPPPSGVDGAPDWVAPGPSGSVSGLFAPAVGFWGSPDFSSGKWAPFSLGVVDILVSPSAVLPEQPAMTPAAMVAATTNMIDFLMMLGYPAPDVCTRALGMTAMLPF